MKQSAREEQQAERERQTAVLRAYGYHWKQTDLLTPEQLRAFQTLLFRANPYEQPIEPKWALLSPLEMPVDMVTILRWIGTSASDSEGVNQFLRAHGFLMIGKDERHIWRIQTPSGAIINLKQTFVELERLRIKQGEQRQREQEQARQASIEQSASSLKDMLDRYGEAMNEASAWGYSPYPMAKRLPDGTIEVTTYEFESEWKTILCQNEIGVVKRLYSDGEDFWNPGIWSAPT